MKSVLACVGGVFLGVSYVLITGVLSIQVIGNETGAAFDLSNTVVGVVAPRLPVLPSLAIAALAVATVWLVGVASRRASKSARWFVVSFSASTLVLVCWSFYLASGGRIYGGDTPAGVLTGWEGWVEEGGRNPATHVVALLAFMSLWVKKNSHTTRRFDRSRQLDAI